MGRFKNQFLDRIFWAVVALVLCQATLVCLVYLKEPMDGYTKTASTVRGKVDSRASGLEIGDKVISVAGIQPERDPARLSSILTALTAAPAPIVYVVERNGRRLSVLVPTFRLRPLTLLSIVGANIFLCIFFAITASMLYLRSGLSSASRTGSKSLRDSALIVCCALVIGGGNIASFTRGATGLDTEALRALGIPVILTYGFAFGLLLHFFLIFPPRQGLMSSRGWAPFLLHGSHLSLSVPATVMVLFGSGEPSLLYRARLGLGGLFTLIAVAAAFNSYRHAPSPVVRNQMRWIAWGTSLGIGPWLFFFLAFTIAGRQPIVDVRITLLFMAVIPVSLLVAISRYKLLEIDGLIRSSLVYTVLMATMTAAYVIAIALFVWFTGHPTSGLSSAAGAAIMFFLFVLAFRPFKSVAERLVTRAFYRNVIDPADAQNKLSQAISKVIKLPEIAHLMISDAAQSFGSSAAALIVFEDRGQTREFATSDALRAAVLRDCDRFRRAVESRPEVWSDVVYPATERTTSNSIDLPDGFAVCFPLSAADRLVGLFLLGGKHSNWLYAREEVDTLRALANQASTAVVNALAYERLNDLNSELEGLVELRTSQLLETNSELESRNAELVIHNVELEQILKELRETQAALLTAERKAAVGEIIIAVCHEINNPLTAIIAQTELIDIQRGSTPEKVIERVRIIEQCAEKIRDIIERMRKIETPTSTNYLPGIRMIDLRPLEENDSEQSTPPPVANAEQDETVNVQAGSGKGPVTR